MSFSRFPRRTVIAALVLFGACTEPTAAPLPPLNASYAKAAPTSSPTVTSTAPSEAPRDTTLDVQINGSGFDQGSVAAFTLGGVSDARVRVNRTRYVKSTQVVANITIAADAVPSMYDVAVTTSGGKKGIGTELFAVELKVELLTGGNFAWAVNASGDVTGYASTSATNCAVADVAYVWHLDGSRIDLPLAPGYCGAYTKKINQSGVVLGPLFDAVGSTPGLWTPTGSGYTVQALLPPSPSVHLTATALNDAGEVIGWHEQSALLFWWASTTGWLPMTAPAGATLCSFGGMNNIGGIVGSCSIGGAARDGYYWTDHNATPIRLARLTPTGDVWPNAINDNGVIVGRANGWAVRWTPTGGGFTAAALPDLGFGGSASAIASDGSIAGLAWKTPTSSRPAMWSSDGRFSILETPNATSGEALGIAMTPNGIVVAGDGKSGAMRWRAPQ